MKPLVTQKIEFEVRVKNDEIVGERKQCPGKEVVVVWEREIKRARSAFPPSAGICRGSDLDQLTGLYAYSPSLSLCNLVVYLLSI